MLTTSLPYEANWFYALLLQEANWLHPKPAEYTQSDGYEKISD